MSGGGSVDRVKGGCKNRRGWVDGEGNGGNGEGEGNEVRGVYDLFQEDGHLVDRPIVDVNEMSEDGESRDDRVDIHVGVDERRWGRAEGGGREER